MISSGRSFCPIKFVTSTWNLYKIDEWKDDVSKYTIGELSFKDEIIWLISDRFKLSSGLV